MERATRPANHSAPMRWLEGIGINLVSNLITAAALWVTAAIAGIVQGYPILTVLAGILVILALVGLAVPLLDFRMLVSPIPASVLEEWGEEPFDLKTHKQARALGVAAIIVAICLAVGLAIWLIRM